MRTAIITALARNPVGQLVEGLMLQGGVDTSLVRWVHRPAQSMSNLPFKTPNAFNDLRTRSFSCDTKVPTFGFEPEGEATPASLAHSKHQKSVGVLAFDAECNANFPANRYSLSVSCS